MRAPLTKGKEERSRAPPDRGWIRSESATTALLRINGRLKGPNAFPGATGPTAGEVVGPIGLGSFFLRGEQEEVGRAPFAGLELGGAVIARPADANLDLVAVEGVDPQVVGGFLAVGPLEMGEVDRLRGDLVVDPDLPP